ncbi:NACHT domain-containing protein [Amycolatopsis japonica]
MSGTGAAAQARSYLRARRAARRRALDPIEPSSAASSTRIRDAEREKLLSDPTLLLGAAAVKLAVKAWLRDDPISRDASLTLVDLIQTKVTGSRDRRKIKRIFEDLEERIADSILSVMESEFRSIPENERNATIIAASETLEAASVNLGSIISAHLNATSLEKEIRAARPNACYDLSSDAEEFYIRIISDCSVYIVEMSDRLPGFQVGVFSTLISTQAQIISAMDKLISELPSRRRSGEHSSFLAKYRQAIFRNLNRLELFGVTLSDPLQGYPLSTAYVSLSVSSSRLLPEAKIERDTALTVTYDVSQQSDANTVAAVDEILRISRRLFIRGDAGSGKSTLLQWLAVQSATCGFSDQLKDLNDVTPFLIRLRNHVDSSLPRPEQFLEVGARNISGEMPAGWVHGLLSSGKALVLVDGVDELPESQRNRARNWLRQLISDFPDSRYIVSSRPAAASNSWLESDGFDPVEIQPMSPRDVETFIQHWHDAFSNARVEAEEVQHVRDCQKKLASAIMSRSHLRQLATSPLLAALICALNLDRRMQLPRDRMELYSVALDMFLERRDLERDISDEVPELTKTDKITILQDLAYWLIRNGWTDASNEKIIERIETLSSTLPRISTSPTQIFQTLLLRSGILRQPVSDRVDFVHRTFQEYLAARAAVDSGDIGALVLNAHDDQWREVVIMAAGHAQSYQREELLDQLLEKSEINAQHGLLLKALAVACLETSPKLSPSLHTRLQKVATNLLPPKTMRQASMLAGAGDFVADLPFVDRIRGAQQAAATIRFASSLGGDSSLHLIARCAKFDSVRVHEEIQRAWPRFDPELFAREVLSQMPKHFALRVYDPSQLTGLEYAKTDTLICLFRIGHGEVRQYLTITNLKRLFITQDKLLTDITALSDLPNLEYLCLNGTGIIDIRPLQEMSNLKGLDIEVQNLQPVTGLSEMKNLVDITLDGPIEIAALSQILPETELSSLAILDASLLRSLAQITNLQQAGRLEVLRLYKCNNLEEISTIGRLSDKLKSLFLHGATDVDLTPLAQLKQLRLLSLRRFPVQDLRFTEELEHLSVIQIGDGFSGAPIPDLSPLSRLTNLHSLYLWGGAVDLTPLAGIEGLQLHISDKKRRQIKGMDKLSPSTKVINLPYM